MGRKLTKSTTETVTVKTPANFDTLRPCDIVTWVALVGRVEGTDGLLRIWRDWPGSEKQKLTAWPSWTTCFGEASERARCALHKRLTIEARERQRVALAAQQPGAAP